MARQAKIQKALKQQKLEKRYANKRAECIKIANDPKAPLKDRLKAKKFLSKTAAGSKVRRYLSCAITGRKRAVNRRFGISRIKLRELAMRGEIPGLKKASW